MWIFLAVLVWVGFFDPKLGGGRNPVGVVDRSWYPRLNGRVYRAGEVKRCAQSR